MSKFDYLLCSINTNSNALMGYTTEYRAKSFHTNEWQDLCYCCLFRFAVASISWPCVALNSIVCRHWSNKGQLGDQVFTEKRNRFLNSGKLVTDIRREYSWEFRHLKLSRCCNKKHWWRVATDHALKLKKKRGLTNRNWTDSPFLWMSGKPNKRKERKIAELAGRVYFPPPDLSRKIERDSARKVI